MSQIVIPEFNLLINESDCTWSWTHLPVGPVWFWFHTTAHFFLLENFTNIIQYTYWSVYKWYKENKVNFRVYSEELTSKEIYDSISNLLVPEALNTGTFFFWGD